MTFPDLFNVYVDDLNKELSSVSVGLRFDDRNYVDNMVALNLSNKGIKMWYLQARYLVYNADKILMVVFRSGKGPNIISPV